MKKILLTLIILFCWVSFGVSFGVSFVSAAAHDRRISDNDGEVLNINSDGSVPVTLAGDIEMGDTPYSIDGGTGGLTFDPDNDGTNEVSISTAGVITSTGSTISGTITLENLETIDNATDDYIEFQGVGGTDNTDIRIDLDGTHPIFNSPTDTTIEIAESLQVPNATWIKATDNAGSSVVNMFNVNSSDEIDTGATLNTGPIELEEDSGAVTAINLPVSATPADGDEESMTFAIDSNAVLKIYGEADSSGGTDTHKVVISDAVITGGGLQLNHQTLTAATLTLDANDGVVECDTTNNAIAITLPECSTVLGQTLTIYFETDNANDVVVTTAAGDTYAGVGDIGDNTATMADAGDFIVIQAVSDTRWIVIQNNGATLSTV